MEGIDRILYKACDAACDVRQLAHIAQSAGLDATVDDIAARLEPLVEQGFLLQDGTRYLALAIPLGEYSPDATVIDRVFRIATVLGRRSATEVVVPLQPSRARNESRSGPISREAPGVYTIKIVDGADARN